MNNVTSIVISTNSKVKRNFLTFETDNGTTTLRLNTLLNGKNREKCKWNYTSWSQTTTVEKYPKQESITIYQMPLYTINILRIPYKCEFTHMNKVGLNRYPD